MNKRFDVINVSDFAESKKNSVKLGDLLLSNPQYGSNQSATDFNDDFRYIRISDIDEFGNLKNSGLKSAEKLETRYLLNQDDLLFARSGATAGKCILFQESFGKAIFAGYLIRFIFDQSKVLPKYVFYYCQTESYDSWTKTIQRACAQPNINSEEYKSLLIPLPRLPVQVELVELMDTVYNLKKAKETEAKKILDSIDDYMMQELGIDKAEEKVEKKNFAVKIGQIFSGRIDPEFNSPEFVELEKMLKKSKFKIKNLGGITNKIKCGTTPSTKVDPYCESGIIFLRNSELQDCEIDLSSVKFVRPELESKLTFSQKNEIIICIAGTIGVCAVNRLDDQIALNQNVASVSVDLKEINPEYLACFLNSKISKKSFDRFASIATISYLNNENLKSLQIPLPPLDIQNRIAAEVTVRRARAKELQIEARQILETAKDEFEQKICD